MYEEYYEDDYRNADPRDHRYNAGAPAAPTFMRPAPARVSSPSMPSWMGSPSRPVVVQPAPVAPTYVAPPAPAAPTYAMPPSYPMPGYPMPGYPMQGYAPQGPGYPGPWGQPPPGYCGWGGWGPGGTAMRSIGRAIRVATPVAVALLPLPAAPTPATATGDCTTDLKASLANEANQIAYQTALAKAAKRDELVYAIGGGIGLLLEKGISP